MAALIGNLDQSSEPADFLEADEKYKQKDVDVTSGNEQPK
jgi:hypothetical protein